MSDRSRTFAPVAVVAALAGAALAGGCGGATPSPTGLEVVAADGFAAVHGATPSLWSDGDRLVLTWTESPPDGPSAVRLASLGREGWTPARAVVARSDRLFVNWADFPSAVTTPDGRVFVHWLARSGDEPYAYHAMVAVSADGGSTWSRPIRIHDDDSPSEHGFVSMVPDGNGVLLVWLDGRGAFSGEGSTGATALIARRFDGETLEPEVELDRRVCSCCNTAAVSTAEGIVLAYRDRSEDEIRDIAVRRRTSGGWSDPSTIHDDGWRISACPVNGPALDAADRRVVAVWFTAADQRPRVLGAFSEDGGRSFTEPIALDDGTPIGRVDVELLDGGSAVASWIERVGEGGAVRVRRFAAGGTVEPSLTVAEVGVGRSVGFPRIATLRGEIHIAWVEPGPPSRVRTARIVHRR